MEKIPTIGFIGGGNMAGALVSGLIKNGFDARNIRLADTDQSLLEARKKAFGIHTFADNFELAAGADVVVLAVKPQVLPTVCRELGNLNHRPLFISVAAGAMMKDIDRLLGGGQTIIRAMPNTPALVGCGMSALFAEPSVAADARAVAEKITGGVGEFLWVSEEKLLDAVTAVSGSGPAYFFLLLEAMTKAGAALGLDEKTAQKLSVQTALGAATMAKKTQQSPHELRLQVTSKGGTTAAAVAVFQDRDFETIVTAALREACQKAREIGLGILEND